MFEISKNRKLLLAASIVFFVVVLVPIIVSLFKRHEEITPAEKRDYYSEVAQDLDRRSPETQITPVEVREEEEAYYSSVTQNLDRRAK